MSTTNNTQPPVTLSASAFIHYYEYEHRISKRQKRRRRGKARQLNIGYQANGVRTRAARRYLYSGFSVDDFITSAVDLIASMAIEAKPVNVVWCASKDVFDSLASEGKRFYRLGYDN